MPENTRFAELLCTRLCHDLTGPIGALSNGAEFLSEEGFNLQGQAVELITSSAFSAVSRLQFYRLSYGYVKDGGEASLSDSKKLTEDFFAGTKITLDWPHEHADAAQVSLSQRMMRLVFNLIIIASGALLRGGTVRLAVKLDDDGAKCVEVTAEGDAVKWDAEIEAALSKPMDDAALTPKNVQWALTRALASALGAELAFAAQTNGAQTSGAQANSLVLRARQKLRDVTTGDAA